MKKVIWSVELESCNWNDDIFSGSYAECVEFCSERGYEIDGKTGRLAKILVDEDGCVLEVLEIMEDLQ